MKENPWFEPMTVTLGKGIVQTAAWGLMARVIIGAVLSVTDLATDLYVLKRFWDDGQETVAFRNAQLASLTATFALQLFVVVLQNRNAGPVRMLKEILIVLSGMKTPWDAYKVAMGKKQEKNTEFDPMTEMTFTKGIELFSESIPGILIQTSAILDTMEQGGRLRRRLVLSLLSSITTTGFISASISYDFDTEPSRRAYNPGYYGYIPDEGGQRAAIFVILMLISSVQVLMKSVLISCLGRVGVTIALVVLIGDMVFYLLLKVRSCEDEA